jgi:hypothetical protein
MATAAFNKCRNVEWTMQSPQEDEFALCVMTFTA